MIDLLGYEQFSNGCCMYIYGRNIITTLYKQLVEIKSMNFVLALLCYYITLSGFPQALKGAQWIRGRVLDSRPRGLRVRASQASLH